MKRIKMMLCVFCLFCMVLSAGMASAQSTNGVYAYINQKLATRTGPSTSYDEPGTFFGKTWQGQTVRVLHKAYGSGVWWLQVEFASDGKYYRVYTGLKRVDTDISLISEESVIGSGTTLSYSVSGYYGPGTAYAAIRSSVPANTAFSLLERENGYLHIEFGSDKNMRRAWIAESDATVYGDYTPAPDAGKRLIPNDTWFFGTGNTSGYVYVTHYADRNQSALIDISVSGAGTWIDVPVYLDESDLGTFVTEDGRLGTVWFSETSIFIDLDLKDLGVTGLLSFAR